MTFQGLHPLSLIFEVVHILLNIGGLFFFSVSAGNNDYL